MLIDLEAGETAHHERACGLGHDERRRVPGTGAPVDRRSRHAPQRRRITSPRPRTARPERPDGVRARSRFPPGRVRPRGRRTGPARPVAFPCAPPPARRRVRPAAPPPCALRAPLRRLAPAEGDAFLPGPPPPSHGRAAPSPLRPKPPSLRTTHIPC